jgi:hypothetical protein
MNHLNLTVRLISAFAAASITLLLLEAVVSIAEPQRSILMAKNQRLENPMAEPAALRVASVDAAKVRR